MPSFCKQLTPLLLFGFLILTACGGGAGSPTLPDTGDISTKAHDLFLPEGITVLSGDWAPMDGGIFQNGGEGAPGLSGFMFQKKAPQNASTALTVLTRSQEALKKESSITDVAILARSVYEDAGAATVTFKITLAQAASATEVMNTAAKVLREEETEIPSLPAPQAEEPKGTTVMLQLTALYTSDTDVVLCGVFTLDSNLETYRRLVTTSACHTNILDKGAEPEDEETSFTTKTSSTLADILFVVDNTSSMGRYRDNIQECGKQLETAITGSGLDVRMGVITTDSTKLSDYQGNGPFTDDFVELAKDLKVGTSGGETESGIYFAEQALSSGGTVVNAGHPRDGATLSIVILSDEDDHYENFAEFPFNPNGNLFFDNGWRAYALVQTTGDYRGTNYMALADSTEGLWLSIKDKDGYPGFMETLVKNAKAPASSYKLPEAPLTSSLSVKKEGETVPFSAQNGWTYSIHSQSVVLHGSAIPDEEGTTINVQYTRKP